MRIERIAFALAFANLMLIFALPAYLDAAAALSDEEPPVLRGRALELVDSRGELRANLSVEPDGEVVLRLRDQGGAIRVKLAAGRNGSGLVLLNHATEVGVQILAEEEGSSLRLESGTKQKIVAP